MTIDTTMTITIDDKILSGDKSQDRLIEVAERFVVDALDSKGIVADITAIEEV